VARQLGFHNLPRLCAQFLTFCIFNILAIRESTITKRALSESITDISRTALEQWCIDWAQIGISDFLEDSRSAQFSWLKPPTSSEILADPFGVEENGKLLILAEHLKHGSTRAVGAH
jgi:hypothetical protein